MKSIIDALIWSSVNPDKISLSIKAGVPFILAILALFQVHIDINPLVDQLILVVNAGIIFITGVVTMYGLLRKMWLTLTGNNKSLQ